MNLRLFFLSCLLCISTSSHAYYCPPANSITCENGYCVAATSSGNWIGFTDALPDSFKNVINYHNKIGCFYNNQNGVEFEMDNIILNTMPLKPGKGPWEAQDDMLICGSRARCEFITNNE